MEKKVNGLFKLLPLVLFPIILLGIGLLVCSNPHGFTVHKIASPLTYDEQWEIEGLDLDQEHDLIEAAFSQPFYYWGTDVYWYGFISEDHKYLLKFFKMHKLLPKTGWLSMPLALFEGYRFNQVDKKKEILKEIFSSVKASYESFKDQTAVIYVHLNKTRRLRKKVELIDQFGKHLFVDLDSKEFILDRKAEHLYTYLVGLYDAHEDKEVRQALSSLFSVIVGRCAKGYGERDHHMAAHYGFIEGKPVLFDADRLVVEETLQYPHHYEREVEILGKEITAWMEKYYPKMVPIVEEELDKFLEASNPP